MKQPLLSSAQIPAPAQESVPVTHCPWAKYEENAKRAKNMDMIGLVFVVVCIGMIMAEAVAMFVR